MHGGVYHQLSLHLFQSNSCLVVICIKKLLTASAQFSLMIHKGRGNKCWGKDREGMIKLGKVSQTLTTEGQMYIDSRPERPKLKPLIRTRCINPSRKVPTGHVWCSALPHQHTGGAEEQSVGLMSWSDSSFPHKEEQKGQTNKGRSTKNKPKGKEKMTTRWQNKRSEAIQ